jgi:hypothetical protein
MKQLALAAVLVSTSAQADSFETHDTIGIDITTLWEHHNPTGDAVGGGPVIRFESFSSQRPWWLGGLFKVAIIPDSSDRVSSPLSAGAIVLLGHTGLYANVDGGLMLTSNDPMSGTQASWLVDGALGERWRGWDLRATYLRSGDFHGSVWLFSLGRDLAWADTKITTRSVF